MATKKTVGKPVSKSVKGTKTKAKKKKGGETESARLIKEKPSKVDLGESGDVEAQDQEDDVPGVWD